MVAAPGWRRCKRTVRRNFTNLGVIKTLRARDATLCSIIEQLYERTLDFGAHPNELAVTGSMVLNRGDDRVEMGQVYLNGDPLSLDHALKSSAQLGLGSLCIFKHIFRERFELLGVGDVIEDLRRQL